MEFVVNIRCYENLLVEFIQKLKFTYLFKKDKATGVSDYHL